MKAKRRMKENREARVCEEAEWPAAVSMAAQTATGMPGMYGRRSPDYRMYCG
jgi:hypothetical protein